MNCSWKTTVGGLATAFGGVILGLRVTGVVEAVPDWLMIVGALLAAAGPVFAGIHARDHTVSSEKAGVSEDAGAK